MMTAAALRSVTTAAKSVFLSVEDRPVHMGQNALLQTTEKTADVDHL